MKIKLLSLLKMTVLASLLMNAGSANAEYYLVYSDSQYVAPCNSCSVRHYPRHRHTSSCHHRYYRHHYSRSHLDMKVYYVWRVYPAPNCQSGCYKGYMGKRSGCGTRYAAAYNTGCGGSFMGNGNYISSYDRGCFRDNCKPGDYCNSSSCTNCQYGSYAPRNGYVDTYNTNDDYNYDMRTADDNY